VAVAAAASLSLLSVAFSFSFSFSLLSRCVTRLDKLGTVVIVSVDTRSCNNVNRSLSTLLSADAVDDSRDADAAAAAAAADDVDVAATAAASECTCSSVAPQRLDRRVISLCSDDVWSLNSARTVGSGVKLYIIVILFDIILM
jgi:hypothetical protein